MKNIKITTLLLFALTFFSCSRGLDYMEQNQELDANAQENLPVISLSATIINNDVTQMNLTNPITNRTLTINGFDFCYGNNNNEFVTCNNMNISNFENSFGNDIAFKLDNETMVLYNPSLIYFNCPNYIDKNTGVEVTWNVDPNNSNGVLIGIVSRLDANGNTYTSKTSNQFSHYLQTDTGSFVITPEHLAGFNSGDMIDIMITRGNSKKFGKKYVEVFNSNIQVAKIQ